MARSSSRPARRYHSKTDLWLSLVIGFSLLAALAGGVIAGLEQGPMRAAQVGFVMLGVTGLIACIRLRRRISACTTRSKAAT